MATSIKVNNIGNRDAFPTRRIIVEFFDTPEAQTIDTEYAKNKVVKSGVPELEPIIVYPDEQHIIINDTSNNVDIRVRLSRNYGGIDPRATVSICNLSEKIINELTTVEFAPKYSKTIRVFAGYETKGNETSSIPLLFSGTILWALPTTGRPDVWFTIQAVENFYNVNTILKLPQGIAKDFEYSYEFVKYVCSDIGGYPQSAIDTSFFDKIKSSAQPNRLKEYLLNNRDTYSFSSTLGDFLKKDVFQWGRMSAVQMSDKLILLPCSADMDFIESGEDKSTLPIISASSTPTMIGIPKPNPTGIDFTTLFDTDVLLPMKRFTLKSYIFPKFDDFVYWVQKVDYDLQLRGQNFYNHVVARRKVQRKE